jgi:NAD(P)-dependent dehydrogenase (short-subunit alcohol dehydrogenase family)
MTVLQRFRLDGRVAIVTGASSGIGVAFSRALAEAGASVALAARREEKLANVCEEVAVGPGRVIGVRTDVTDPDDCRRLVDQVVGELGRVDVLINNAGIGWSKPASQEQPAEFRRVYEVNVFGAYWMAQAVGRVMEPGSAIVNVASVLGLVASDVPQAAYSSSKAAIVGLTRDLAAQWSLRKGIRVNAVAPGFFPSEMTEDVIADTESGNWIRERSILRRVGELDELTPAMLFLATDASSFITGVTLPVDGGWSAR